MTEAGYCRVLLDKKDTKITELESDITKLRIKYEKQIVELQQENRRLKEQIEKMKNCRNCKNEKIEGACGHFTQVGCCKNWELTE